MSLVNSNAVGNRQLYYYRLDPFWNNEKINFTGEHIYVLNEYVPLPMLTFLTDKQIDLLGYAASAQQNQSQHLIYPCNGNAHYHFPFERLYFSSGVAAGYYASTVNTLGLTVSGGTVLALLLSEKELGNVPEQLGKFWRHDFTATLPAVAGQADFIIQHNPQAIVSVSLTAVNVVNPLRLRIYQRSSNAGVVDRLDVDIWAGPFPYKETFVLAYQLSATTRIIIDGGGAAEAGTVYVEHLERPQ